MSEKKTKKDIDLDDLQTTPKGAGFNHELGQGKNWERSLDVLHWILLRKWYYVATLSNTHEDGWFNMPTKGELNSSRAKSSVPNDLYDILSARASTFGELDTRIRAKQLIDGDKDVWHFRSQWKEFPKGTGVIMLFQKPWLSKFKEEPAYRKAYVVIDGAISVDKQNNVMLLINKVFKDDDYVQKTYEELKDIEKSESIATTKKKKEYMGRLPGELILLLKENFDSHHRALSMEEKEGLNYYFKKLRVLGEYEYSHKELYIRLKAKYDKEFDEDD